MSHTTGPGSSLTWGSADDDMPWESDKFSTVQEHMIKLGVHTAPIKAKTADEQALEFISERETKMNNVRKDLAAQVSELEENQLRDMDTFRKDLVRNHRENIKIRDKDLKPSVGTYGKYIGQNYNESDQSNSESDDDLFGDDEENDRALESLRAQRIAQIRTMQQSQMASATRTGATILNNNEDGKLSYMGGIRLIEPIDFTNEVITATEIGMHVAMLIVVKNSVECDQMLSIMKTLAGKFPDLKVVTMLASSEIKGFPPEHSPTLLVYGPMFGLKPMGQFVKLAAFNGKKTKVEDVEWKLACLHAVRSELTEDPKDSILFEESERRIGEK